MGVRPYKQVKTAEARSRLAEQETSPSPTSLPACAKQPPESAKQRTAPAGEGEAALSEAETAATDEWLVQLRAIASDLLYWKGGLKVTQRPKWRGSFKWQIEAKIDELQAAYARVRADCATPEG